ncbi:MAG: HAD hydrolase-like protein [Chromatiales bacterium]|jgi:phosphoglycolate phosphatase
MYAKDSLIILDADGTTVDAFTAINRTFLLNGMDIGDVERFQKRRNIFKYLGGLKELPKNLSKQLKGHKRSEIIDTLTEVYREEAQLYAGLGDLINRLLDRQGLRVGVITRNITHEPEQTLRRLYQRCGVAVESFDFFTHLPLKESKTPCFREVRERYLINPARAYASGDERKDYLAAVATGMHPFMVSYGFESYERLIQTIGIPSELISRAPDELKLRVLHALEIE